MAVRDYTELAARMRHAPTFGIAEEVIRKDFPLKLPARTFIQLFSTPEISQFRGYQDDLDEAEKRRAKVRQEKADINTQAQNAAAAVLHDMGVVHEMLNQQRQSAAALGQRMSDLNNINRREMAGMHAEQRAELVRLHAAGQEAANRQMIAETALSGLQDMTLAHRGFISELAARQGHVVNHIDARHHTTNNITNQHMADMSVHNQAMNMLHTHAQQFGRYTQERNLSDEQMQRLLYEHLRREQEQRPLVLHMTPQPQTQVFNVMYGQGLPPPTPPGAGAIAVPVFRPEPTPVPTIPASVQPPPPPPPTTPGSGAVRIDSGAPEGPRAGALGPVRKEPRDRGRAPWNSSGLDPPAMPAPQRGRRKPSVTPAVPIPVVGPTPTPAPMAGSAAAAAAPEVPSAVVSTRRMPPAPVSRGRSIERKPAANPLAAPARSRSRREGSKGGDGSMAPTVRYPSPAAVATKSASVPARARSRSHGRSAPGAAAEGPAPAATAPGAAPPMPTLSPETIFVPSTAKQERAKVASRIKRKQLKAKTLAEEAAEGTPTTRRVRMRVGGWRPRGRPRKKLTNGDEIEVPASSSKSQGSRGRPWRPLRGRRGSESYLWAPK